MNRLRNVLCLLLLNLTLGMAGSSAADAEVTLQVTPVEGAESHDLDFGTAKSFGEHGEAESDTVVRRVRLTITSSSSGRYQVFQQVNAPWINSRGKDLPADAVQFFVSESNPAGDVRLPNPTPLRVGGQELYLSNASGSNTELIVTYTTRVPVGQQAGQYRTTITYRVVSQ